MITYTVESLSEIRGDIESFLPRHWEEIALSKEIIKLNVDWMKYEVLDKTGVLKIVAVRDDSYKTYDPNNNVDRSKLIGYYIGFIVENPHYKGYKMGQTDIYYLDPEYRKGHIGSSLFKYVESMFKNLGCVKLITSTKIHKDASYLFKHLGWTHVENIFTKDI